jgi:hypothetical protein
MSVVADGGTVLLWVAVIATVWLGWALTDFRVS